MERTLFIISYDIEDDKRRDTMRRFLSDYGYRVQKSVFECFLTKGMYEDVKKGIMAIMDKKKDRARIYTICQSCRKRTKTAGVARLPEEEEFVIV
ncbi:MAG: CRISPR-associated endonuclease Cas2 [Deltaproteobacteria bacterium]|nr:CRISPR-associated endonuclease Cas2 [Deltaproteobacteria bacterium]